MMVAFFGSDNGRVLTFQQLFAAWFWWQIRLIRITISRTFRSHPKSLDFKNVSFNSKILKRRSNQWLIMQHQHSALAWWVQEWHRHRCPQYIAPKLPTPCSLLMKPQAKIEDPLEEFSTMIIHHRSHLLKTSSDMLETPNVMWLRIWKLPEKQESGAPSQARAQGSVWIILLKAQQKL